MTAALVLAACGGNVVVDGAPHGHGGDTTIGSGMAIGGAGGTGGFTAMSGGLGGSGGRRGDTTSGGGGFGGQGDVGVTTGGVIPADDGGGGPCTTCAESLAIGGEPCSGLPFEEHAVLLDCACTLCSAACTHDLCVLLPASPGCFGCMAMQCDLSGCVGN